MQTQDFLHEGTGILPAPIYNELRRRIDAAGGVGYGSNRQTPSCIGDFAAQIDGLTLGNAYTYNPVTYDTEFSPTVAALRDVLGHSFGSRNDAAVLAVNYAKGDIGSDYFTLPRISFDELAAELGLRREVKIPQAVYDALEASAEEYGGIGGGAWTDGNELPLCAWGHLRSYLHGYDLNDSLRTALEAQTGSRKLTDPNDIAVAAINRRKGKRSDARVSFAEWTRELGYVRGDA